MIRSQPERNGFHYGWRRHSHTLKSSQQLLARKIGYAGDAIHLGQFP